MKKECCVCRATFTPFGKGETQQVCKECRKTLNKELK